MFLLFILILLTVVVSTLTTIPIIVAVILCFTVLSKNPLVFIAGIVGGLFIDLLYLRTLGITSLFLVIFTFLIFLYQRKFEIQTLPFIAIASFIGSFIYLIVFGYKDLFLQALVNATISVLLFRFAIARVKLSS